MVVAGDAAGDVAAGLLGKNLRLREALRGVDKARSGPAKSRHGEPCINCAPPQKQNA